MKSLIKRRRKFGITRMPVALGLIKLVIDIPAHAILLPIESENVKVICESSFLQLVARPLFHLPLLAIAVMQGPMHAIRLMAHQLDNVDLTTVGPIAITIICRHHP